MGRPGFKPGGLRHARPEGSTPSPFRHFRSTVLEADYFDLQLQVARRYAAAAQVPFDAAVAACTNLRRRLNLHVPAGDARWRALLARLAPTDGDRPAALALCLDAFAARPAAPQSPGTFGCFSCDLPDAASGTLRLHFMPPQGIARSPLARDSMAERHQELRALFRYVRQSGAPVRSVMGVSWLYHLDAYRRLFPPAYGASAAAPGFALHLTGSSTWGQVLGWRQTVKPDVRDAVLARLRYLEPAAPWKVFPLQALAAHCPVAPFHDWFA